MLLLLRCGGKSRRDTYLLIIKSFLIRNSKAVRLRHVFPLPETNEHADDAKGFLLFDRLLDLITDAFFYFLTINAI